MDIMSINLRTINDLDHEKGDIEDVDNKALISIS